MLRILMQLIREKRVQLESEGKFRQLSVRLGSLGNHARRDTPSWVSGSGVLRDTVAVVDAGEMFLGMSYSAVTACQAPPCVVDSHSNGCVRFDCCVCVLCADCSRCWRDMGAVVGGVVRSCVFALECAIGAR